MSRTLVILNEFGETLKTYEVPDGRFQFEGVNWEGVELTGAVLTSTNFADAFLYWAILYMANLDGVNFQNAILRGADLKNASCVGANFRNADLSRDNLNGRTQLQGANMSGALLHKSNLDGAEYDKSTQFPKGFRPETHNMVERDT